MAGVKERKTVFATGERSDLIDINALFFGAVAVREVELVILELDGSQAAETINMMAKVLDLVVVFRQTGSIDGFEVLRRIRDLVEDIPVMFVGSMSDGPRIQATGASVDEILPEWEVGAGQLAAQSIRQALSK